MKKYIGFDMGATNLRAGVLDPDTGDILASCWGPTAAHEGPSAVIERMAALMEKAISDSGMPRTELGAVGIGVPGVLDLEQGLAVFLPNLPGNWPQVPLAEEIAKKMHLPVYLLNDVRAITYGEYKMGAGRGSDQMACYAVGTGIGGGLVLGGKLLLGIDGTAGELGHISIDYNGPRCGCGNYGCVEAYASGPAIAAAGIKAVAQGLTTDIGKMAGYDFNKIDAGLVAQAARQGDRLAKEIYRKAGFYLGVAIASMLVAVSVDKVVIGGGVAAAGALLLNPIRETIKERVSMIPADRVRVVPAQLGDKAGLVGSAMWARDQNG